MKYSEMNLDPLLNRAIEELGYIECTPIQAQTVPLVLSGKDVAGLAQTGTGKTAAFLIPLIEIILRDRKMEDHKWNPRSFALVLVPTRELAEQVYENLKRLAVHTDIKGFPIFGGTGYEKQKEALKEGLQFVIATPGRLIDLYKEHLVDLNQVRAIVFDEADRMFDMGFKDDMKYILQRVPKQRQFLVFSATLNFDVLNTAYQFGAEPVEINISKDQAKAENVTDSIFHVGHEEKPQHLLSLLKSRKPKQAIVFTNFKHNVERIAKFLNDNQVSSVAISSLLSQVQRTRVMQQFKEENDLNILVATDVAARGLDIKGVDLVVNYELPNDSESYVHRIGRTGRAGSVGIAYSLVCDRDIEALQRIEDYLHHKLKVDYIEDQELIKEFKEFPQGEMGPGKNFQNQPRREFRRERQHHGSEPRKKQGPDRAQRGTGSKHSTSNAPGSQRERFDSSRKHPGRDSDQHGRNSNRSVGPRSSSVKQNQTQYGKSRGHSQESRPAHHRKSSYSNQKRTPSHTQPVGIGAKISRFFKNLFGSKNG